MTRYISNPDNLKLMMNMLKEKSRNIQFEAFHVFKVLSISIALHFYKRYHNCYTILTFVLIASIGFRCKSKQTKTYTRYTS